MTILNRPMFMNRGGQMRHDERTIRNVDDELYRIAPRTHSRGRERINAREEYARDLKEKDYLRAQMNRLANGGQPMPMPMAAPPMPMGAAPMLPAPGPGPEAQVQMTEAAASQEGEALGQEYLGEMMTGIDTADSTEELIDAIRGNDKTLQDRYDELANFVGERDASATPESVLTLVQPTIMMTEQGAMDSGIGELMQGIAGEVEMETEMGAPTPMGQGVGELMMTESVEEVIPQMNAGGPVQYFANGMEVSNNILDQFRSLSAPSTADQFSEMVESRLPVYQRMLGDTDQTKKDIQSKLYFDMAQAGLNLASGVDPRTGQSMTGRSLGSQIASAAQPVAASAGQAAGEMRNVDRAAAAGALQSAEAAEAARIGSARLLERDLLGGAIDLTQYGTELAGQTGLIELQANLTRQRDETLDEFAQRLQANELNNTQFLQSANAQDAMARLNADAAHRSAYLDQDGNIRKDILYSQQELEKLLNTTNNAEQRQQLQMTIDATRNQYEYNGALQESLQQKQIDASMEELLQTNSHQLLRQARELDERAREFDLNLGQQLDMFDRQLNLDTDSLTSLDAYRQNQVDLGNLELAEARERRIAGVGGEGTELFGQGSWKNPLNWPNKALGLIPVIRTLGRDSALNQNADAMANLNTAKRSANEIAMAELGQMGFIRAAQQNLAQQAEFAQQQFKQQDLNRRDFEARMSAIADNQRDLSTVFGSSYNGILQGMMTDQSLLDDYSNGSLDRDMTNVVDRAMLELTTPIVEFDPRTGITSTRTPTLPRAVQQALGAREAAGLPSPIAAYQAQQTQQTQQQPASVYLNRVAKTGPYGLNNGPPFIENSNAESDGPGLLSSQGFLPNFNPFNPPGMQDGGDPGWAAFKARTSPPVPSGLEPTATGGQIVDETINFETTTGLPSGFQRGLNVVSDTFRDVTGIGPGPIFPDVERGGEQLKAIANMTQRFIRDSVAGRPFAVEIEALAEEIAQPGGFRMDERNLVKLQTMRSQLLEIGDIATSILDAPQGFDQKSIMEARQDLTQLSPLIDNYNKIITSYEIGLGKQDKPDPSMFERGMGNAQGSAAGYARGSIMGPPPGFEEKNMTFLGYDTGVPNSAMLANQGGPITRRRS